MGDALLGRPMNSSSPRADGVNGTHLPCRVAVGSQGAVIHRLFSAGPANWRSRAASRWLICSGTPLRRLGHRQVFVDDHRLKSSTCTLFGRGDHRVSFSQRGQHLDRQSLEPPVTFDSLTPIPCLHLGRRPPRCLPHSLLAHNHHFPHRRRLALPYAISRRSSGHNLQYISRDVPPSALRNVMADTDP